MVFVYILVALSLAAIAGILTRKNSTLSYLSSVSVLLIAASAYYIYFEQHFAKSYGGNLNISIPSDRTLLNAYWKGSSLMLLTYQKSSNKCFLQEASKFGAIEGTVIISECK